jgi:Uma2 family endonuclease
MQVIGNTVPNLAFSSLLKRYTLEEFWALPEPDDRSHYELIEGVLHVVPPPSHSHDLIIAFLNKALILFVAELGDPGTVFQPRASIHREDLWGTYLEPDMMYVSNELREKMGDRRTSADIVFECVSEGSSVYDHTTKADTYLALGVRELWLVDSDKKTIEVRSAGINDGMPSWERRLYTLGEAAESSFLNGWAISVDDVFAK